MKNYLSLNKNVFLSLIIAFVLTAIFCSNGEKSNSENRAELTSGSKNPLDRNAQATPSYHPSSASEAMEQAQNAETYLSLLFYDRDDDKYRMMRETVTNFRTNSSEDVQIYEAQVADVKEANVVKKFGIDRAPLPVTLIFAPNGAITGGFPQKVTSEQLEKCIVPELTMTILKSVQANRVALVLLTNRKTKFNREVTRAATEFSEDKRLNGFVDIIQQNPQDSEIKNFLTQCRLDENINKATAVLIVPPGRIGGVYSGDISKDTIIAGLAACSAGSGCCGP